MAAPTRLRMPGGVLALLLALGGGCAPPDEATLSGHGLTLPLGGEPHRLAIADTREARARGLMERTHLPRGEGMLFVYVGDTRRTFWNRGTRIPLDVIFLDAGGRIRAVESLPALAPGAPDSAIVRTPDHRAAFVLELGAGEAARLGLVAGARVDLPGDRLRDAAR